MKKMIVLMVCFVVLAQAQDNKEWIEVEEGAVCFKVLDNGQQAYVSREEVGKK